MFEFFKNLFEADFMPHGHCYYWEPAILWSHAISDGIIALAYCAIPFSLITIFRRHHDLKFIWMMILFAVFIFGCGVTHVFDVINIWVPYYRADSVARVITAIASVGTAAVLLKATPDINKIPSISEWRNVNLELKQRIAELEQKDKLIETMQNLESFALALPQIMFIVNKKGIVTFINEQWHDYTGSLSQKSSNTHLTDFFQPYLHQQDCDGFEEKWRASLNNNDSLEMNVRIKSRDNNYKWFLLRAQALSDEEDPRWVCTFTDIDEQINRNQELTIKNEELTRLNNDLDNFVYAASHDLRSPINNLEGIIGLYQEEITIANGQDEMWYMLSNSVSRLKNTINDIGDVAKLQRLQPDDVTTIQFSTLVEEIKRELEVVISAKNARITTNFEVSSIRYSQKNLKSIILNLLTNSLKYTRKSLPPEIQIKTYTRENRTVLEITDNGIGIKKEHQAKIFEMFRRFNSSVEGTGLGLYLVKRILDNTGGVVEVESEEGKSTTLRIIF